MSTLAVTLERWAAWAPGLETEAQWQKWANGETAILDQGTPDVDFLPAMFRRRLSRLSKMSLRAAHDCVQSEGPLQTVFCSRHGELSRTVELLKGIANNELLSPTAFSASVHNTASGLYSIASNDRSPSTAIAAGTETLESAFLATAAFLHLNTDQKAMLVISDEPLPAPMDALAEDDAPPYAAAFLFSNRKDGRRLSLSVDNGIEGQCLNEPHALALIRFLFAEKETLALKTSRANWIWRSDVN